MIETAHSRDPRLGCPVLALQRDPRAHSRNVNMSMCCDRSPGRRARIYTFIYTMANCLRPPENGVPVIVTDRPNPWRRKNDGLMLVKASNRLSDSIQYRRHG